MKELLQCIKHRTHFNAYNSIDEMRRLHHAHFIQTDHFLNAWRRKNGGKNDKKIEIKEEKKKTASRLLSRLYFFLFFIFILPDYCIRNLNHHRFIFQQQRTLAHSAQTHAPPIHRQPTHNASKVVCGDGGMHRLPYMVKTFRQTVAFQSTHWAVSNSTSTIIKSPLYMNQQSSLSSSSSSILKRAYNEYNETLNMK